ncbi:MAG: hypothetical protein ACRBG0_12920 [Lewinella sp.]|uniref:hypothetical protein n=1 Tax=Lewinella sp. TaxID=2004506 RepID=UPI003D6B03EB
MKHIYWLAFVFLGMFTTATALAQEVDEGDFQLLDITKQRALTVASYDMKSKGKPSTFKWPWRAQRMDYFSWWSKKVTLRIMESFQVKPGVRYMYQKSSLSYVADETILGGNITIDDDLLNAVNLPSVVERPLEDLLIELPTGQVGREVRNWTSLARCEANVIGITMRANYWSGALSPGQFPQPLDINKLFDVNEFVGVAARELAATSALNNAVSLELLVHPFMLLTGFRQLEWNSGSGIYLNGDFAFGWVKATDLTFKQGRELLGEVDMGQEIRNALPDPLENLINTDEAGQIILDAAESRLPLYGFGLPVATGKTMEFSGALGYRWANSTWTGDASIGLFYQTQQLSNDHPSNPELKIQRITPTVNVKWIFNKRSTESSLFEG